MFALVTSAVIAVTFASEAASQNVAAPLFTPVAGAAATDRAPNGLVRRSRAVTVAPARLQAALAAGQAGVAGPLFTLNLFDDVALPAMFERAETDAFGHQSWIGRVVGDANSAVTLTWRGDVLSGSVQTGGDLYQMSTRDGAVVVEQLEPGRFGTELPPVSLVEDAAGRLAASQAVDRPAAGEVVDIYVYYTAAARIARGGQAQIEALIAQGIADSNTTYVNSNMQASLRLVGTSELAGYIESATDMGADLSNFRNSVTAQNTRNAFNADLMHLVVGAPAGGACGIAYLGPSVTAAYGVSAEDCFGQYTFTHEIGHNFGNSHAPEDGGPGWKSYAFGYKNCFARFRTVQAYACTTGGAGTRIRYNANPNVLYTGLVTGTATEFDARAQSEAFPLVQGWRAGASATLPSAPQNLQVSAVGNQITVTWAAPATGAPIASYTLQAGTGPGLSNLFNGAVGSTLALSAPVPNGTYYVRVVAQNAAGFGPPTTDAVAVVGPAAPGPPANLSASVAGSLLTVNWQPPASGGSVSTYVLQAGSGPGLANIFNGAVGLTESIAAPVPPGAYYLRVLAQGPGGTSPPTSDVIATVTCPIPSAPVLSGSKAGNVISLNWTTPSGATGFTLRAGNSAGLSNLFNAPVGAVTAIAAPVGPGTYFIRVSATSACGQSGASNEVALTIP